MKKNKDSSGFSLLEVLIALVILAIAFTTSYFALNNATRHLIDLRDKTAAAWVGLNAIAYAQLGLLPLAPNGGTIANKNAMFQSTWNWQLTVTPTPDANVSQIRVIVSKARAPAASTQFIGYLFNKTMSPNPS